MNNMLSDQDVAIIHTILSEQLGIAPAEVQPGFSITELGADSLDVAEISMKLEEQFNITIPDEQLDDNSTVEDLYEAVADLLERTRQSTSPG